MPLETGKSKAAFEHNLKAELASGKPKDQALAIAYKKQREDSICDSVNKAIELLQRKNG